MICKKCNFQNEEPAKFCKNCGTGLLIISAIPDNSTQIKKKTNVITWVMSALFVLSLIAFIFTLVSYNQQQQANTELQAKLSKISKKIEIQKESIHDVKIGIKTINLSFPKSKNKEEYELQYKLFETYENILDEILNDINE